MTTPSSVSFTVTTEHGNNNATFGGDHELRLVRREQEGRSTWSVEAARLGCSREYAGPVEAVASFLHDHGLDVAGTTDLPGAVRAVLADELQTACDAVRADEDYEADEGEWGLGLSREDYAASAASLHEQQIANENALWDGWVAVLAPDATEHTHQATLPERTQIALDQGRLALGYPAPPTQSQAALRAAADALREHADDLDQLANAIG